MTITNAVPKFIALLLVSVIGAWLMRGMDASVLSRIDSMPAADYVQNQRELHHHSVVFHFFVVLMLGGFYLGVVEFLSYVIALGFKRKSTG